VPGVRIIKNFGAPCTYYTSRKQGSERGAGVLGGSLGQREEKEKEYERVRRGCPGRESEKGKTERERE